MTDPRPICPIPPDARVGDIVVLRSGERCKITSIEADENTEMPYYAGGWWMSKLGVPGCGEPIQSVSFEYADGRKPNLPHTGKPKRTQAQRDAAWLRKFAFEQEECGSTSQNDRKRIRQIADRMEGKT